MGMCQARPGGIGGQRCVDTRQYRQGLAVPLCDGASRSRARSSSSGPIRRVP